jgi:hypothetical protein
MIEDVSLTPGEVLLFDNVALHHSLCSRAFFDSIWQNCFSFLRTLHDSIASNKCFFYRET